MAFSPLSQSVQAEATTQIITGPTDIFVTVAEPSFIELRAYGQSFGIDTHLWLYDSQDQQVAANDDYFGLDSYINYDAQPGQYRIRAGVCCGNPDGWYGDHYELNVDVNGIIDSVSGPTTSTTSTTTVALYLNAPNNVQVTHVSSDKIYISWDSPIESNTQIEQYIVLVDCDDGSQPHLGAISQTTSATIENLPANTTCKIRVRADNDTVRVYSPYSVEITGVTETTTTTSSSTTTTTLPLTDGANGCGPYRAMTVTGTTGGTVWGSGPYTDDSNFSAAAVHAGLIQVGETAVIEPYAVDDYKWYDASYANGVYTNDWHSSWCGYQIKILGTPTPTTTTTTTTTSTTTTIIPTSTTIPPSTTVVPSTTTTTVTPTTTVVPSTTTLVPATTVPVTTIPELIPTTTTVPIATTLPQITVATTADIQVATTSTTTVPSTTTITPSPTTTVPAGLEEVNEQLVATVTEILSATDTITVDQLDALLDNPDFDKLDEATLEKIADVLSDAPTDVKEEFEGRVNVFGGGLDSYVPVGSNIPVGTRRVLIAATAATAIAGAASVQRKN